MYHFSFDILCTVGVRMPYRGLAEKASTALDYSGFYLGCYHVPHGLGTEFQNKEMRGEIVKNFWFTTWHL
jgi:hypothetical protein